MWLLSEPGMSQSALNFPKIFSVAELSTSGFAVINPGPTAATINFALLQNSARLIATATRTIPAGGQLAQTGSELFPSALTEGWVLVTSETTGLQGFWLNYDAALTFLDGAEAASSFREQIIPLYTEQTEVFLATLPPLLLQRCSSR